jgi:predicted nucleic acid-binding protein
MMDRIFLDTNLLLDFVLDRKPFSDQVEEVIASRHTHKKRLFASTLSFANVAYVVRKADKNPFETVEDLFEWIEVVSLTKNEFELSFKSNFKDFEDALQFYSALSIKADVIITRDVKDFFHATIPVHSPLQFLKTLK